MGRKRSDNTPLNARQDQFALEYALNGGNATEAYRVVYGQGNYSDETLASEASHLRNSHKVDTRIQEYQKAARERTIGEKHEALGVLTNIMRANPSMLTYRDAKTGKTKMRSPQQLHKAVGDAIKTMTNDNGSVSYTFESKIEAIRVLSRLLGWETPQELNVNNRGNVMGELRIGFDDYGK